MGDIGLLTSEEGTFEVTNTVKGPNGVLVHIGRQLKGDISVGDVITAEVNEDVRRATMRNHTAAHLLQAALRSVLGTHVEQAGQLVNGQHMRFDFTHFAAMTAEELDKVQSLVNHWILEGLPADIREMPIDEAKKLGAMALFGEKYGNIVRVVCMGDTEQGTCVSTELCGGTHVDNTAKLGLFRIVSESSVAAGVRRIEAVTGTNVLAVMDDYRTLLAQAAEAMKVGNVEDVARRAQQLSNELKDAQRELEALRAKMAAGKIEGLFEKAKDVEGVKVMAAAFANTAADAVRSMCDSCREKAVREAVVVICGYNESAGTVSFGCYCGPDAIAKGAHAGNIVREVAKLCGGNGGGRPDSAMAGGKDVTKVKEAIGAVEDIVRRVLAAKK